MQINNQAMNRLDEFCDITFQQQYIFILTKCAKESAWGLHECFDDLVYYMYYL